MELPKNITQIGIPDKQVKVYMEDYVVSYMKQFGHAAADKEMAIALYGNKKEEDGITFMFIYGAVKLKLLKKENLQLTQMQMEEIEHSGKVHFPEYTFLAYCLLNGEMVEGVYMCEGDRARYVSGYARFYEKNDKMLSFLIESRGDEIKPEIVDLEKYEIVKRRQEELKNTRGDSRRGAGQDVPFGKRGEKNVETEGKAERTTDRKIDRNTERETDRNTEREHEPGEDKNVQKKSHFGGRFVAGLAAVALMGGFAYNNFGSQIDWQGVMKQAIEGLSEKHLPDAVAVSGDKVKTQKPGIQNAEVQDQKQENVSEMASAISVSEPEAPSIESIELPIPEPSVPEPSVPESSLPEQTQTQAEVPVTESIEPFAPESSLPEQTQTQAEVPIIENVEPSVQTLVTTEGECVTQGTVYIVLPGDTLNGISLQMYHTVGKVEEICRINGISDPDTIKEGQKILLP